MSEKISSFQLYNIMLLSRIFAIVTYAVGIRQAVSGTNAVAVSFLSGVLLLVLSIPAAILIKTGNGKSLLERSHNISRVAEILVGAILLIDCLFFAFMTCARFELLAGSVMFPEKNVMPFVILIVAVSALSAMRGLETIARSGFLFLFPVVASFLFVFLTSLEDFDTLNFTPLFYDSINNLPDMSLYAALRSGELSAIILLYDKTRNQKARNIFIWAGVITVLITITRIIMTGVLGSFEETQLFSMYSLTVHAKLGFIERLDAIITCIWMVCAGVKLAVAFYLCRHILTHIFGAKRDKLYVISSLFVVLLLTFFTSRSVLNFSKIVKSDFVIITGLLAVVVVPIFVIILEKIRRRNYA